MQQKKGRRNRHFSREFGGGGGNRNSLSNWALGEKPDKGIEQKKDRGVLSAKTQARKLRQTDHGKKK